MTYFELPKSTIVNRFIPKNAFDEYTNSSQKKKFTNTIEKITWLNKLSKDTINLDGIDVKEIQIFEVKLKAKEKIQSLLAIIDKAIPYHIIFIISFDNEIYLSTSKKHNHINNENIAVIDWSFTSEWKPALTEKLTINLKESIDFIFTDFCSQITGFQSKNLKDIIEKEAIKSKISKQIEVLESRIKKEKQFNIKVQLNSELKELKLKLEAVFFK